MKTYDITHSAEKPLTRKGHLALFRTLFVGRSDAHAISKDGKTMTVRKPLDNGVLRAHLTGKYRVGSYLVGEDNRTSFLVFDIDRRNRALVRKITRRLRKRGVTSYVERSKSKGFHIWVFFAEQIRAKTARKLAHLILQGLKQEKIEIFPKQDVVSEGGLGNCIWLPYFPPDVERERTVFVDGDFQSTPKFWSLLRKIKRVPKKIVVKLAKKVSCADPPKTRSKFSGLRAPQLAPCAQAILLRGVAKDHRNKALFTLAKHLRNAGLTYGEVMDLLNSTNERCRPPLKQREVSGIVKSVFDKKYTSLDCEDAFIASLCGDKCPVKKKLNRNVSGSAEEVLARAEEKPPIHPAQAFHAGILWYGQKVGREYLWVNSRRKAFTLAQMKKKFTVRPLPTKARWRPKSIQAFVAKRKKLKPDALFINLRRFISERIHFRALWQVTVVTLWLMGTYVHRVFEWYGYLWLTSPGRRAGKSRLLEVISSLAYNATPLLTDPTEASLFREPANNASTQVLDEVESLRGTDQEKRAAMMSVLNGGFKARVKRPTLQ